MEGYRSYGVVCYNRLKVQLWRVEDSTRRGPYSGGYLECWKCQSHCKLPNPVQENIVEDYRYIENGGKCAFDSASKLKGWFMRDEIKNLQMRGYKVVRLLVDEEDIIAVGRQVVFIDRR